MSVPVDLGIEERRLVMEAIATLAHMKNSLVEFILSPAGVPADIANIVYQVDAHTGKPLTKRKAAPLIVEEIERSQTCPGAIRAIVEIAGQWNSFHLADNEYEARAIVQKARELLGTITTMAEREERQRELTRRETLARMDKERTDNFRKHNGLLLNMFDAMATHTDPHQRGYLLQELINRLFDLYKIPVVHSFTRNSGGEQIDGAFTLDGWHYLTECRWRTKLSDVRDVDGLLGQVQRSGKQTMRLYLSINGWSENVIPLLKQNIDKSIILMQGYDLRTVMANPVNLRDFMKAKIAKLNLEADPYLSIHEYIGGLKKNGV